MIKNEINYGRCFFEIAWLPNLDTKSVTMRNFDIDKSF